MSSISETKKNEQSPFEQTDEVSLNESVMENIEKSSEDGSDTFCELVDTKEEIDEATVYNEARPSSSKNNEEQNGQDNEKKETKSMTELKERKDNLTESPASELRSAVTQGSVTTANATATPAAAAATATASTSQRPNRPSLYLLRRRSQTSVTMVFFSYLM
uniref:Uncharacterized protein n=1 Tax=Glossina brevipalpis TaxID=37001 RepID=A0A1A9W6G4_9MUSC